MLATTPATTPSATPATDADFASIRFRCPDPRPLDSLLPDDHDARRLWDHVGRLDLSALLQPYRARVHHPGRPPVDVRLLLTLWLVATHEGIVSARQRARRCRRDD